MNDSQFNKIFFKKTLRKIKNKGHERKKNAKIWKT